MNLKNKGKKALVGSLAALMLAGAPLSYAAVTKTTLTSYFDSFTFFVNGMPQSISDRALKPFIAENRVYVPLATLNNLGIADVQWTPAAAGQGASLQVTPKVGADSAELENLRAENNNLRAIKPQLEAMQATNKVLTDDNAKLKAQVTELENKLKNNSTTPDGAINDSATRKLENTYYDNLYRTPLYSDYRIPDSPGVVGASGRMTAEFSAKVSPFRNEIDIELSAARPINQLQWNYSVGQYPRDLERYLLDQIVDPANAQFKDVKDLRLNIKIYDQGKSKPLGTYTYERGRLTGQVNKL